jgi:type IV pilus assembly protein PilM
MSFLNKKIFNKANEIIGLDLSDLSAKVFQLGYDGEYEKILSYGSVKIPQGSIIDGEIIKKELVISSIKKALSSAGPKKIKTKKVICSIPETKAFLRIISIPNMDEGEIKEAIKWEMEANIPLPIDQVYYDWQVLRSTFLEEKNKMSILVVAVAKSSVDPILEVIEMAGLDPVGLEIESIAQDRSLVDFSKKDKTIMVVDIGDRRTSFSITRDGIPCFTSSIPLSGQSITEAIAKSLSISTEEAEKTKINYGIGSDLKNDQIFKSVKSIIDSLALEIERSIDFFINELKYSEKIDSIIICGGGANTKGLILYLSKKTKRSLQLGDPWINLNFGKKIPIINRNESVQYSTVIGLALKGIKI